MKEDLCPNVLIIDVNSWLLFFYHLLYGYALLSSCRFALSAFFFSVTLTSFLLAWIREA